ncbi:MAG: hypothetical protein KKC85_06695 [Gammaproteobacteria bacterium]|nr:hypothetical protein [Gammaproteobacteria bacterium]MBU1440861.1 hypothetical protein [Gammaproteobacteria bacterium]MBU2286108.1 hypothetical protein [Gammaproteobacteria bacterium]
MNPTLRSTLAMLAAATAALVVVPATAQMRSQPQTSRSAVCDGVEQDRQACLREMGAARQAASNGNLTSAPQSVYTQNALARCSLQPPGSREECEARIMGTGRTTIDGSVMGGGLIRETVTPIPPVPR